MAVTTVSPGHSGMAGLSAELGPFQGGATEGFVMDHRSRSNGSCNTAIVLAIGRSVSFNTLFIAAVY